MDQEQEELQFLGFFGIFKESFKIITTTCRKILTQITLSILLPLSFIFLAHIEVSDRLFGDILRDEYALDRTPVDTPRYSKLSDLVSDEWTYFWLFKLAYFIFFLVLSLLSTSAVVYTIAAAYAAKEMTFRRVMTVVPKVWKRLMVTFLWTFVLVFAFNILALVVLILWAVLFGYSTIGFFILILLAVVYTTVFVYLSVVWHLASVVSVLEDDFGIQAMLKSKNLIKGKVGISVAIFCLLNLCFFAIQFGFQYNVVIGKDSSLALRTFYAVLYFLSLAVLILFSLTVQTVVYFVCKSYHHENIDKSLLADHLEVYLGDYVPLKSKDVQLEHFDV